MTSRERLRKALNHESTDRPPIDMGATNVTGISASMLSKLRDALGLPKQTVKIHEPLQLLGMVEDDVRQKLGIDVIGLSPKTTIFGYRNEGWKPWKMQDGTDVLVSTQFETTTDVNGDILIYPKGDRTAKPSGRLPKGGYYFDAITRQGPLDEDHLDPNDWAESFGIYSEGDLNYLKETADQLYRETDYGIIMNFGGGGLGDIAYVPGQNLIEPKGLRDPELWYEYLASHPDYIAGIFDLQTATALKNLELLRQTVGEKVDAIMISGSDFGTQRGCMVSPTLFRSLWKPRYRKINDWVHQHTNWKTFYHSCGSITAILDDFVEMGVDILNPVQCSAEGMAAEGLKARYGDKLVFWGGGVDTQKTLPFGTVEEVRQQVRDRVRIFSKNGGFVFNTIHNIQARTPVDNVIAMFETATGRSLRKS